MASYYTPKTLAETWGCSLDAIYEMLWTGKLKGFRVGRHWRVSDEARLDYERGKDKNTAATVDRRAPVMRVI